MTSPTTPQHCPSRHGATKISRGTCRGAAWTGRIRRLCSINQCYHASRRRAPPPTRARPPHTAWAYDSSKPAGNIAVRPDPLTAHLVRGPLAPPSERVRRAKPPRRSPPASLTLPLRSRDATHEVGCTSAGFQPLPFFLPPHASPCVRTLVRCRPHACPNAAPPHHAARMAGSPDTRTCRSQSEPAPQAALVPVRMTAEPPFPHSQELCKATHHYPLLTAGSVAAAPSSIAHCCGLHSSPSSLRFTRILSICVVAIPDYEAPVSCSRLSALVRLRNTCWPTREGVPSNLRGNVGQDVRHYLWRWSRRQAKERAVSVS